MRPRVIVAIVLGIVVAVTVTTAALAADTPIPGRLAIVRTGRLAKLVAKGTFPLPTDVTGSSIAVFDTLGTAGADTYPLVRARSS